MHAEDFDQERLMAAVFLHRLGHHRLAGVVLLAEEIRPECYCCPEKNISPRQWREGVRQPEEE